MEKYRYSDVELEFMENCPVPFAVYQFIDQRVVTIAMSGGFIEMNGFSKADKKDAYDLMDNNMYSSTHPDDMAAVADAALRFATEDVMYDVVYRARMNGQYRMIHAFGTHIYKEKGIRLAFIWYTDLGAYVGDGKREKDQAVNAFKTQIDERSIRYKAQHDLLTGLPSMSYFFDLADAGCKAMRRKGQTPVILFLDFNGMKVYNQKYGMEEGDRFLKAFSEEIIELFSHENCSRFNADHFCVYTDEETAVAATARLIDNNQKLKIEKKLPLRIGMFRYDDEDITISGACDRAKLASDSGRKNFTTKLYQFDKQMMTAIEEKQYVVENLDRAIEEGWIKVFYQPIVRTANGRVCYEEALARWVDPQKGFMNPAEFIPALEDTGHIYKLDLYVLESVLRKLREHETNGLYMVPQTINLSRSDFYTCDIVEEIRKRVDQSGISRKMIVIEITESIVADDVDYMTSEIKRFKELGFEVWMDDYGSGYSSPEILHRVPFDLLKIDMLFVRQLEEDEKSKIILTEIVRMAMSLGLDTIAEGVENESQAGFLKDIGCTMYQGFYFCKPLSFEDVLERYRTGRQIGFENPEESDYYAQLGKVNMYNLTHSSTDDDDGYQNYFDTWPMVMVECDGDRLTVVKANVTFKKYVATIFPNSFGRRLFYASDYLNRPGGDSMKAVLQCARDGKRVILNDRTLDGRTIQVLVWRIAVNPVKNVAGVMVVILSAADAVNNSELHKMAGEYNKLQQENARLKEEADANRKIAELKKSVSDLLENMPVVTFSKDVVTGKYLACNQAFAEYANKESPEGVIGLTDHEIFDAVTADHFVEDDRIAMSMDEPYIFCEDVLDGAGNPRQFETKKLKFTDNSGRLCLLGLCQDVTDAMRIKMEYTEKLALVQNRAEIDALTGIKNYNAYKEREELMNLRIQERRQPEFAIVVFDVNDLKLINDTQGHEAGDKLIREACGIICKTFKRSPAYRIGGDEFVVISQDEDYARSDNLVERIARHNEEALANGGVVIACGMARFNGDDCVADVFRAADMKMYEDKTRLKSRRNPA